MDGVTDNCPICDKPMWRSLDQEFRGKRLTISSLTCDEHFSHSCIGPKSYYRINGKEYVLNSDFRGYKREKEKKGRLEETIKKERDKWIEEHVRTIYSPWEVQWQG